MKSCCSSTGNDNNCKRKDGKTFSLPRKFSKGKCKNPKGFTMRSSCAPYKYCNKGGKRSNSKKLTKKRVLLPKLRPINNKNVKHKYKLSDPQSKRILAIDEGIRDEAKKTGKTLKKAAISKKGRFNILRIYRKNKRPQECKRITSDMKYMDKKYGLGKTTNICKDNKTSGNITGGKKDFLYNPDNPKKSFDVYIDKNPKDTIPIKYKTLDDVKSTIKKLERLYKNGKYPHKRIWQVGMIMKVRLESLKSKKPQQYKLANKYFKHLGERSKIKNESDRKKFVFKITSIKKGGTIENKRSHSEEPDKQTTKKQRLFDPTTESRNQWPSFKGPGEILEITDLISCIAVIVKKYENGKLVGVVGGHFITSEAFSVVDNMLTDEGKYFMEDLFKLLDEHEMTPDNTTTMLVIRPTGTRKPHPETKQALKILKPMFENKNYNVDIKITPEDKNVSKLISVYSNRVIVKVPE